MKIGPQDPLTMALTSPVTRAYQAADNWSGKVLAIAGAAAQLVWADFFVWVLVILFVSHGYDWLYGRSVARILKEFDEEKSALGLRSKMASVFIVLLVRLIELALAQGGIVSTRGLFAAGIAVLLVVQDIHSIEAKRVKTGHGPVPFLSRVLSFVERAVAKIMPDEPKGGPDGSQN